MSSRSPQREVEFQGIEPLEPRLLLSAASPTVELFQGITPLFVENQGQWSDADVRYAFSSGGVNVAFTDTGLRFQIAAPGSEATPESEATNPFDDPLAFEPDDLADATWITTEFSLSFTGAHAVSPVGVDLTPTRNNYLLGSQDQWRTDVPTYHGVAYYGLYDGVDLFITGQAGQLKYEFHVAPPESDSGDPAAAWQQIQLDYDGVAGLSLTADGGLWIDLLPEGLGHLTDQPPVIYQDIDGQRVDIAGHFDLREGDAYGFTVTQMYDATHPLIFDPEIAWFTSIGGEGGPTIGNDIAVDAEGNILVTGRTSSSGWVSGGYDSTYNGGYDDAFVVKLSSTGGHLWSTYLGGIYTDIGYGIVADVAGDVLVTGFTDSTGWVSGGYDTTNNASREAFVVKLSPSGVHLWSTYLGGNDSEYGNGIALDAAGNILVVGSTYSSAWISGGYDTTYNGASYYGGDGFVAKLSSTGEHLWSSYLGGLDADRAQAVAVDVDDNVLVAGNTESPGWISGGFDTNYDDYGEAFVVKLSPTGEHLWSTYLGDDGGRGSCGIAVDSASDVLVASYRSSAGWIGGASNTTTQSVVAACVVKLSPTGEHIWSTSFGGIHSEMSPSIHVVVDVADNILVAGTTTASGWVSGGYDTTYNGSGDVFAVKLRSNGIHVWSTYLGGTGGEDGAGIAVDAAGNILVAGMTGLTGWISGGYGTPLSSSRLGTFVIKFSESLTTEAPTIDFLSITGGQQRSPVEIVLEAFDPDSVATLSLYYDTDDTGENGKLIASGLTEADGTLSLTWDVLHVTAGDCWLYAVISDGIHDPVVRYASAPIAVTPRLTAFEPNDTIEQAADLGTGDQHLIGLSLDDSSTDVDWFRWTASHDGVVYVDTDSIPYHYVYSIPYVMDESGQIVQPPHPYDYWEHILVTAGQTLWIQAVGYDLPTSGEALYDLHLWEYVGGDCNQDGLVNVQDINPFLEILAYPDGYQSRHPELDVRFVADLNRDGQVNVQDINPFVQLLAGASSSSGTATSLNLPATDSPAPVTAPITAPVAPSPQRFAPLESSSSHASAKPWWTPARPMFENLGRSAWLWEHWSAMFAAAESAT
ncbi:MAG: SBBP repeat-containing protein [Phycisphaeraceae bacterium]|nr:SBBP repeat-containing protein [Phycisphaeraceae bacterium]